MYKIGDHMKKNNYLTILQIIIAAVFIYSLLVLFLSNTQNNSNDSISIALLQIDIIKASSVSIVSILLIMFLEFVKNERTQ